MSELDLIKTALTRAARRRRIQRGLEGLAYGLFAGAILFLIALGSYKLFPLPSWIVPAGGGVALAVTLGGFIRGIWRRMSLLETARWVDEQDHLKERLSTALELAESRPRDQWQPLLLDDAAKHAQTLDPKKIIPFGFPHLARWALLALALAAGLGFVPAYRTKAHVQKERDAANIKDVGRNLSELMRRELLQKPPALPATQKSMDQAADLGELFGKHNLTRSEALRNLTSVTEKIAQEEQALARNPGVKSLQQAARNPDGGNSPSPESLQNQIKALQKALGEAAANADQLDKLSRDLQKLKQQAANLGDKDSQSGSAAREQLSRNLGDLARAAREAGLSLDSLEEAIQALQSNNTDLFLKDLEAATHDLEKMRNMAKAMQQLQEQAAKLGKDLPEQLEKGQGQAAIQTLQKMIDQLKSSKLSQAQIDQIIKETLQAAKPGSQYGKVGELLKKAAGQCQAGNKSGAADQLAAAQDELRKLMDQMADAEALQATLDALARAQMAISQSKSWGQCQGAGQRPGFGPGGKPGGGVGTWADEYGWTYFPPQDTGPVDNSGVQRPDMDPRGQTDRPDDLSPGLTPDKVKGRMSPGGSMPSITLKGVSIKGASRVQFEEAAAAAQKDAQNALNQDQVPRHYQNAVRDYFDDMKK